MELNKTSNKKNTYWFVGASYGGGTEDKTEEFASKGIWVNGYVDKYTDLVKSIQKGDHIAIKSTYTRKKILPFDNRGNTVSVMAIKATGIVRDNLDDGRNLKVDWELLDQPWEWYFYTNQTTVWMVQRGEWKADALIDFTFGKNKQDILRFRNDPQWSDRFGDKVVSNDSFEWVQFYESFADGLLIFNNKREDLLSKLHVLSSSLNISNVLQDQYKNGRKGPLEDICPFTLMNLFNRGSDNKQKCLVASELAILIELKEKAPDIFDGIPNVNNQKAWFFGYEKDRGKEDIDNLWDVLESALVYADSNDFNDREKFIEAYDKALKIYTHGWKLSTGLSWIRPWKYLSLDVITRSYIQKVLNINIDGNKVADVGNAQKYLDLMERVEKIFKDDKYSVHSFPSLTKAAADLQMARLDSYDLNKIIDEGCFLGIDRLEEIMERLEVKQNVILQGAPGTGKSWLSKKIAYALIGGKDNSRVRVVQFHPNISYEDFIRGFRPQSDGKLTLVNGPFLEMIDRAKMYPGIKHVFIIEEINRGNPANIFGEMLTLLEDAKRKPLEAMELCYHTKDDELVYVPDNFYVIGTMNIADRSLALVDFAFRRRFAFITLEPIFGSVWRDWVNHRNNVPLEILNKIEKRMLSLNEHISKHNSLGPQFKIGHSYVTPATEEKIPDAHSWFRQVVETEIRPLLEEYWFDTPAEVEKSTKKLLEGF